VSGDAIQPRLVLEVRDLRVSYGTHVAVDGLNLDVHEREVFGLLGPNGAGKTSTLSAIEGLRPPTSGIVLLDGTDVAQCPVSAKAKMGVQLQTTSFPRSLPIREIVRLYAGLYGLRLSAAEVVDRLRAISLEADGAKSFTQLSGGQQRRLALSIAVIGDPVLLLLDEPTAGLDPQSRRQLWARIDHLREGGGSILVTTHSMEEAQAVCDRVAIIDHGSLVTEASPSDLVAKHRDDPRVLEVAHGPVTLEDVFIGLTGSDIRD
jgi:ABC-2 type transport system ATP-binding protein